MADPLNSVYKAIAKLKIHRTLLLVVDQPATIGALPVAVAQAAGSRLVVAHPSSCPSGEPLGDEEVTQFLQSYFSCKRVFEI